MLRCAMLCCAALRYAMLCCAMLLYAGLCYDMLCCAMLCYAMMSPAMLKLSEAKMRLRGRSWGNRGAGTGGTARGAFHCPAPLSPDH
eukprot:1771531-Pyramimonas_sp.AAC.1